MLPTLHEYSNYTCMSNFIISGHHLIARKKQTCLLKSIP